MATFINLIQKQPRQLVVEVFEKNNSAEETRRVEYNAAVRIQSWYRKIRTHCYLKYLSNCALSIQKAWRGYIGRKIYRIRVKQLMMIMRMNHYNAMAVMVQKFWRGSYVRKHIHDFYARKRYLNGLLVKNEMMRRKIDRFVEETNSELRYVNKGKFEDYLQRLAKQSHHLISTTKIPGIYNSPFWDFPAEMELRLRAVRHNEYIAEKPKKLAQKLKISKELLLPLKPHPPENNKNSSGDRIQGPFKSMVEVRKQRYKPFNSSLRCETSYYAVDIARKQMKSDERAREISSERFRLYGRYQPPYIGLDHTKSSYDVSNKLELRQDDPKKNISKLPMRCVLSPIPYFDRLGEAYTKGAVLL